MVDTDQHSFGVFKPVDHVVISFATPEQADAAAQALSTIGLRAPSAVHRLTDREMLQQIDHDLQRASPLASIGQEVNLIKAHLELAERGYHWLVVYAPDDRQAARVAHVARTHGAERAQRYGNFIIEELITPPVRQVAESPDRGLDAQTRSGAEFERAHAPPTQRQKLHLPRRTR
ncbi:MAG TPA: hypothetical protein VFK10_01410 [Burkholderiaceae bacterium]|nr:hypothetical protein [Burkholderiaceae bacterium]